MSDVFPLSGISDLSLDSTFISSLLRVPAPMGLSVLSFFCLLAHSSDFFPPENYSIFFVKR